ncbi:MAG TPA: NUDIX domain-containing protein, partial [candidate division UBP10 bacterium]|nr:NUDIX domain-containing protein [Candidatus Binatota bacterium]
DAPRWRSSLLDQRGPLVAARPTVATIVRGVGERRLVVGAAIVRGARVLAARRTTPPEAAGRWELPGGKVEPGEQPADALEREIAEELGCTIEVSAWLSGASVIDDHLELRVAVARIVDGDPEPHEHDRLTWVGVDGLDGPGGLDWMVADRPFLPELRHVLRAAETEQHNGVLRAVLFDEDDAAEVLRRLRADGYEEALDGDAWREFDAPEPIPSDPDAWQLFQDGRSVAGVDISPFISDLPGGRCTRSFVTDNASGSTSQAANIIEALEAGARLLLIDEDSSATNFMIRDRRMQELVANEHEPITPFVDRVRQLCEQHSVSSVIVIGGSGDYLDVADKVVGMRDYRALDLTAQAREVVARFKSGRRSEALNGFEAPLGRTLLRAGFDASRGRKEVVVKVRDHGCIVFGEHEIDLSAVDQLLHPAQLRAVAEAMLHVGACFADGNRSLAEVMDLLFDELAHEGLSVLARNGEGDLAAFRRHDFAAAVNRLRAPVIKLARQG